MSWQTAHLIDPTSARVACVQVALVGDRYSGTISLDKAPAELRQLFGRFEELAEGQMFSLADEVEEQIEAWELKVVFEDGAERPVEDLQVYPSTRLVSFRLRGAANPPSGMRHDEMLKG